MKRLPFTAEPDIAADGAAPFALPDDIEGRNSQSIPVSSAPSTYEFSSHIRRIPRELP